jgi:cyclopropane-fatty-acyl-phospholipid synthase
VVLQVITIPDQRYDAYRRNPDWIQKHIFPGGMLPSLAELAGAMARHSSFVVEELVNIGPHYAPTLRAWRGGLQRARESLRRLGYDDAFLRKWVYYFCYCEAGFEARIINDLHLVLRRPGLDPAAGCPPADGGSRA